MVRRNLRVVLDPTILVEALVEPGGACGALLVRVSRRDVELVVNESVLELWSVTLEDAEARQRGGWSAKEASRLVDALAVLAVHVSAQDDLGLSPAGEERGKVPASDGDAIDRSLISLARRADALFVTTDAETLDGSGSREVEVLRPETVVEVLEARAL